MAGPFRDIEPEIPRLRRYARALTRDAIAADDLVQDCLTRALGKLHLWREETDLRAWLFTVLHNQHINHLRRTARGGAAVRLDERNRFSLVRRSKGDDLHSAILGVLWPNSRWIRDR